MALQIEKSETFFCVGGGGPLRQRQGGCHSTSTSLALKVIRIVCNPPFGKFLDPPLYLDNVKYVKTSVILSM